MKPNTTAIIAGNRPDNEHLFKLGEQVTIKEVKENKRYCLCTNGNFECFVHFDDLLVSVFANFEIDLFISRIQAELEVAKILPGESYCVKVLETILEDAKKTLQKN